MGLYSLGLGQQGHTGNIIFVLVLHSYHIRVSFVALDCGSGNILAHLSLF
jgi:hypothetical protein